MKTKHQIEFSRRIGSPPPTEFTLILEIDLDPLEALMADFTAEVQAKLDTLGDALTASTSAIKAELDSLKADNPTVDVSALEAHIDQLTNVATALPQTVDAASQADPNAPADPNVPTGDGGVVTPPDTDGGNGPVDADASSGGDATAGSQ